jgi:hypothetical protein
MIQRFKSFTASNDVDSRIDSFIFELINMNEVDVKEAVIEFVQWAIQHQRQNHKVTLVGHASIESPLLNEK